MKTNKEFLNGLKSVHSIITCGQRLGNKNDIQRLFFNAECENILDYLISDDLDRDPYTTNKLPFSVFKIASAAIEYPINDEFIDELIKRYGFQQFDLFLRESHFEDYFDLSDEMIWRIANFYNVATSSGGMHRSWSSDTIRKLCRISPIGAVLEYRKIKLASAEDYVDMIKRLGLNGFFNLYHRNIIELTAADRLFFKISMNLPFDSEII